MEDKYLTYLSARLGPSVCAQLLHRVRLFATPVDDSLAGSSVPGILQARMLEWVPMPSFRGSSQPRDRTRVSCIAGGFFTAEPLDKPLCPFTLLQMALFPSFLWLIIYIYGVYMYTPHLLYPFTSQ